MTRHPVYSSRLNKPEPLFWWPDAPRWLPAMLIAGIGYGGLLYLIGGMLLGVGHLVAVLG